MKTCLFLALLLWAGCSIALSQSVDKNQPSGRACISVVNTASGDEEALRPTATTGGPHHKIVAHLDATAKCEVLVALLTKSGQPASDWRPQYAEVPARSEMLLPKAPVSWTWDKETGLIEVDVLFLAPGSKEGSEIRALVGATQHTKDETIARLQTNKLRELIGRMKFDKTAAQRASKPDPELAGVMRMVVGFEWRDSARAVNFTPDKPGVLIFPTIKAQ
jgi:hypothetical protein